MTIGSTTVATSGSTGNGATVQFSFSFHIDDYGAVEAEDQIQVILETISTGAETVLTRGTHYTVSINGDQSASPGGSITTIATYSSSYKIWIRLAPSFLQSTDMQAQGAFNAEVVEDQWDQNTRQINVLADYMRRAPRAGIQAGLSFSGEITGDLVAGAVAVVKSDLSGYEWAVNNGSASSVTAGGGSTSRTLSEWFRGLGRGSDVVTELGHFTDKDNGVNLWTFKDRVRVGDMALDAGDTATGGTWIHAESLGNWIPRSAQFGSHSTIGGIGVHGASRVSDRYQVAGVNQTVWAAGQVIAAAGVYRGYQGKLYVSTGAGTTNSTPPTHTTGTVSDGTVSWTFVDYAYGAPIGVQGTAIYDTTTEGQAAWAGHFLAVRKSSGGTIYGLEIDLLNRGSDVTNNPYSISPAGSTIGIWLAAGYDVLASVNPATCAIVIGQSDSTWNSGIVFESDGITSGGYSIKLAAVDAHTIGWFESGGTLVSSIHSDATANNERVAIRYSNRQIGAYAVGGLMGRFESAATAGTAADEHIRLIAYAAGAGNAEVRAGGTAADVNLMLTAKGAGSIRFSGTVKPVSNDGASLGISGTAFSDIFLASGAVINFNAGDVTLTHASNLITIGGGDLRISTGFTLDLSDTQSTVGAAGGASALPATPTGYTPIKIGGSAYVIPYYAAS